MITEMFNELKQNKVINAINAIMNSKWMLFAIVLLAGISNIFALEIPVYYIYLILIITAMLFCSDTICLLPIATVGYMTFAKENNPMSKEATSSFLNQSTIIHLAIIASLISLLVISRIIFDLIKHKERRKFPKLLFGFVALGLTYLLGGLFSPYYSFKTFIFGIIQIIALSFTYFCFYYTVDWKNVKKDYFALLFTSIGFLMVIEIFNMLIEAGFFITQGAFSRSSIYTGWGINNNVVCVCLFTIPAPFYYTLTQKNGWRFIPISTLFLLFTILTQSRNGMLMGSVLYCLCALVVLIKTSGKERMKNFITFMSILLITISSFIIFNDKIQNLFSSIYKVGASDSGRFKIYIEGFKQYLDYPLFGNGFYACKAFRWGINNEGLFLPGRYHNTYVQILASCGTVGIIAYLYHKYQTIKMCFKSKNPGATIITLTLIGFILICLLDCHFHNFGPGLLYSAVLLLLEMVYNYNEKESPNLK